MLGSWSPSPTSKRCAGFVSCKNVGLLRLALCLGRWTSPSRSEKLSEVSRTLLQLACEPHNRRFLSPHVSTTFDLSHLGLKPFDMWKDEADELLRTLNPNYGMAQQALWHHVYLKNPWPCGAFQLTMPGVPGLSVGSKRHFNLFDHQVRCLIDSRDWSTNSTYQKMGAMLFCHFIFSSSDFVDENSDHAEHYHGLSTDVSIHMRTHTQKHCE